MILGATLIGHDSGFSVIDQGRIVSVLELERVNGDRFALNWPLCTANLKGGEKQLKKYIEKYIDETLFFWKEYSGYIEKVVMPGLFIRECYDIIHKRYLVEFIKSINSRFNTNISTDIFENKHHLSHAALACFTSPFESSIVVSIDGMGNDGYFNIYKQIGNRLNKVKKYSLKMGKSYQANAIVINDNFGYSQSAPGKLMGLSAYGRIRKNYYKKSMKFIKNFSKVKIKKKFSGAKDINAQNWMKSFQQAWTDIILKIIKKHVKKDENLCLTGGCALNGITNYQIYKNITKNIYVPPNPNDSGIATGAALYYYYVEKNNLYTTTQFQTPFCGIPVLDNEKMDQYFSRNDYRGLITLEELARNLRQKKIIGIISGKSELGPRALGNRSIICDCSFVNMRDILNNKVKFREWYRPFAPIVRREDQNRIFDFDGNSPYMSYVVPVRDEYKDKIPSVVHVDGTARLQTVTKESSRFLYDLLSEYDKQFKICVLLNTSFNIKGSAILSSLKDAFGILENTQLDGIYIDGNFWCK